MKTLNKRSGVTLLELSIVLIIISTLTVIVIGAEKLIELSRLARAKSITVSPVDTIEGLSFWVEPTLKTSLTITEALDGNTVSTWNDLSPTSTPINISQATTSKKPIFRKSAINKLPALEFDNDDFLESSTYAIDPSDKTYTIIAVWQPTVDATSDSLIA